jgi:tryptophan synthase alpha chain
MPSRYEKRFADLKASKNGAFVPFTLLGWPSRTKSLAMIKQMIDCGASALELGIAFSDPVADGPVIQRASAETIYSGFSVSEAFELLGDVRKLNGDIPIGILVYFNTILAKGIEPFFARAKQAGVDGVLVADLPAEAAEEVLPFCKKHGIDLIFLVSPLTTAARLDVILAKAGGFLYLVSRLGVTGTIERSKEADLALRSLIEQIKARTQIPICAGFGISSRDDAKQMFDLGVDGVISGSRVIQISQTGESNSQKDLENYYSEMLNACQGAIGGAA